MICNKYTLHEAFEKRLLKSGECVDLCGLYKPYKTMLVSDGTKYSLLSLESYFNRYNNVRIEKKSNNEVVAYLEIRVRDSNIANIIASKLLSTENTKAKINKHDTFGYREFLIMLNLDIIVSFKGEEEKPYLELPPHTAYIF